MQRGAPRMWTDRLDRPGGQRYIHEDEEGLSASLIPLAAPLVHISLSVYFLLLYLHIAHNTAHISFVTPPSAPY
jgi:hypothetical protein